MVNFDIASICIHGKGILKNFTLHPKYRDNLIMKQMFDISEKLIVGQSDGIYGVTPINCEDSSWKRISLVSDEEVISLSRREGLRIFRFCVYALERWARTPQSNYCPGKTSLTSFKGSSQYRTLDTIDCEPMEFEWNISQDSPHCSSATKSKSSCQKWAIRQKICKGRTIFMSMFNDISRGSQDNEQECELSAQLVFYLCEKMFTRKMVIPRTWIRKRSGILLMIADHKEEWDQSRWIENDKNSEKADTQFYVPRVHCPEER